MYDVAVGTGAGPFDGKGNVRAQWPHRSVSRLAKWVSSCRGQEVCLMTHSEV